RSCLADVLTSASPDPTPDSVDRCGDRGHSDSGARARSVGELATPRPTGPGDASLTNPSGCAPQVAPRGRAPGDIRERWHGPAKAHRMPHVRRYSEAWHP